MNRARESRARRRAAARRAKVASIAAARARAKKSKPGRVLWPKKRARARRHEPPAAKPRRPCFTFTGGKKTVFEAIDHASDGMLSRYLEKLDDGSPHLRDLTQTLDRTHPLKSWRQAIDAVTPPNAYRWTDVNPDRLLKVSIAMRAALEAGGGGGELARSGLGWTGLQLPLETQALLERQREAEGFFDERARKVG